MTNKTIFSTPFTNADALAIKLTCQYMKTYSTNVIVLSDLSRYREETEGKTLGISNVTIQTLYQHNLIDITEAKTPNTGRLTKKAWKVNSELMNKINELMEMIKYFGISSLDKRVINVLNWANNRKTKFLYADLYRYLHSLGDTEQFTISDLVWHRDPPLLEAFKYKNKEKKHAYAVTQEAKWLIEVWTEIKVILADSARIKPVNSVYAQYYKPPVQESATEQFVKHALKEEATKAKVEKNALPNSIISAIQRSAANIQTLH